MVFEDPHSIEMLRRIRLIAPSEATVLVIGETGTGKEVVARYLHELSRRSAAPFISLNCGALASGLADAELFGFERGAFTGALSAKEGWFEAAQGGTLFLDEIGDLPLPLQVKLLRVLQEREVVRLGSRNALAIDVRIVAATNIDLAAAVRAGNFREDLFFRLNVATIAVPPLRDRPGDIIPLAEFFLRSYAERAGIEDLSLSDEAIEALLGHPWPGNVRELDNLLHRAVLVCQDGCIEAGDIFAAIPHADGFPPMDSGGDAFRQLSATLRTLFKRRIPDLFEQIDNSIVLGAYDFCHENQVQAARLLGATERVVRYKVYKYGIDCRIFKERALPRRNA